MEYQLPEDQPEFKIRTIKQVNVDTPKRHPRMTASQLVASGKYVYADDGPDDAVELLRFRKTKEDRQKEIDDLTKQNLQNVMELSMNSSPQERAKAVLQGKAQNYVKPAKPQEPKSQKIDMSVLSEDQKNALKRIAASGSVPAKTTVPIDALKQQIQAFRKNRDANRGAKNEARK